MPPKIQKSTRVQSSKATSDSRNGEGDKVPDNAERRLSVLERENMMLRKNLNMTEIMKEFKRSFSENDMQQMFFESLHELQQKLMQYESGKGVPASGSLSDVQKDLEKERRNSKFLEQEVNEKNKMINEKDKELKGFRTELELQKAHVRHSAEAVKKLKKLETEFEELKQKIMLNETTIQGQSAEITRLKKALSDSERSTMSLQEEMSEIEALRSELRENIKSQEEQTKKLHELKRTLEKSDRKCRETEALLKETEKTLEERNTVIKKLNDERQSIDEDQEHYSEKILALQKVIEDHLKTAKEHSAEKIEMENKYKELRNSLDENDKTIKALIDENTEKEKELLDLREKDIANEKIKAELKGDANSPDGRTVVTETQDRTEEINKLKEELAGVKRSYEKVKAEREKLEFTCHEAFDKLNQKEKQMKQQEEEHKKKMDRRDDTIQKLRREMNMVDPTAGGKVKVDTKDLVDKYEKSEKELKLVKEEIDELKNRLSKAGMDITTGSLDLNDTNKPSKLSERLSQLYDSEWTDAYDEVKREMKTDEQTIIHLYKTLEDVFDFCKTIAEEHAKSIQACVLTVPYAANGRPKSGKIDGAKWKQLREVRRSFAPYLVDSVFHHFINTLKINLSGKKKTEVFIKRCIEVCWLMCAQDPPVILDMENQKGREFDGDKYRTYTKAGKVVEFVVWPPVVLHKDGPLLCKGVAQCK